MPTHDDVKAMTLFFEEDNQRLQEEIALLRCRLYNSKIITNPRREGDNEHNSVRTGS